MPLVLNAVAGHESPLSVCWLTPCFSVFEEKSIGRAEHSVILGQVKCNGNMSCGNELVKTSILPMVAP